MKYWLALGGILGAIGINHWLPDLVAQLLGVPGFIAGFNALGVALTASWASSLSRLSAFEKIEDLPASARDRVIAYVADIRRKIIWTIIANALAVTLCTLSVFLAQTASLKAIDPINALAFILCGVLGFWIGGFIDNWRCYTTIEISREEFVSAQIEIKRKVAYLEKLRKEAAATPVPRDDRHLNSYTSSA